MMRKGLIGTFILLALGGAVATEVPPARLQGTAPWSHYDDFMKLTAHQRRARFNTISAENRATILQTHVKRWLHNNRGRLTAGELAVFEEIIAFLSPDLYREPDGDLNKREGALWARMRCRVIPEDVREATDVFGEASESPPQKVNRGYLRQAKCWIDWMIESVVDYVPNIGR